MPVLSCEHLTKAYTLKPVLTDLTLYLEAGERLGIVGINGTGKSTLLRLLYGAETPDAGTVMRRGGLSSAYLPQMPEYTESRTCWEQVLLDGPRDDGTVDPYEARSILMQAGIRDADADVSRLSGGQKKRVALAAALVRPVDLLFLDEPTNHLDAGTIVWLEEQLRRFRGTLVLVTHDRYFLDRITTKILELDQGHAYLHEGSYALYLEEKAQRLEMESAQQRKRSAILRQELEWIRRGAQARSTKQKARIQRYEALSAQEGPRSEQQVQLQGSASRLGRKIIEMENVSFGYDSVLFQGFTYTVQRRERMAIVGDNGTGKTTLLRLIAGEIEPGSGTVSRGDTVKLGFFRQEFPPVPPEVRVIDYMRGIAEYVQTEKGRLSASQMLERFLFPPDVQLTPVERLSGGEKRRLYLCALLMGNPNVLLLDEPTNDLDVGTLEILEDYLVDFEGAVIAVSHDRWFLDRTVNRLFAIGDGQVNQYVCSFSEYLEARAENETAKARPRAAQQRTHQRELRMSYKEAQEFAGIDARMAMLTEKLSELDRRIGEMATDYVALTQLAQEKEETQRQLQEAEERWLYLTDLQERIDAQKAEKAH